MTIPVSISPEAESRFRRKAAAVGEDVATYVGKVLERVTVYQPSLRDLSGPLADEFARSGMSEEELAELLEREKHAMRAGRRKHRGDA